MLFEVERWPCDGFEEVLWFFPLGVVPRLVLDDLEVARELGRRAPGFKLVPGETGLKGLVAAVLGAVFAGKWGGGVAMNAPTVCVVSSGGNPREVVTRKPGRVRVPVTLRSSNVSRCAIVRRIASFVISAPARLASFSQTAKA